MNMHVDLCNVNGTKVKVPNVSTCTSSDVCNVDNSLEPPCELKVCTEKEGSEPMTELTRTWDCVKETGYQLMG